MSKVLSICRRRLPHQCAHWFAMTVICNSPRIPNSQFLPQQSSPAFISVRIRQDSPDGSVFLRSIGVFFVKFLLCKEIEPPSREARYFFAYQESILWNSSIYRPAGTFQLKSCSISTFCRRRKPSRL